MLPSPRIKLSKKEGSFLQNAAAFRQQLLAWYRAHRRDLPWRRTQDPYAIMVSELMLQQTQVKTVIPYFERFMKQFPTPQHLSEADDEALLNAWQGLGYYRRARHLREAASMIVEEHGGHFPTTKPGIDALKGVGAYTSAAIASIAFELPHACVDGNVIRVLSRLYALDDDVTLGATKKLLQRLADDLIDTASPGDFNQAMMELGATVCTPKKPSCMTCPVRDFCQTLNAGQDPLTRPNKPKKLKVQKKIYRSLLIACDGQLLLARRRDQGLMAGMWELPTQDGEAFEPWESLLDAQIEHVGKWQKPVVHKFTHIHASYFVDLYRTQKPIDWTKVPNAYSETRWMSAPHIVDVPITKVLAKVLEKSVNNAGTLKDASWQDETSQSNGQLTLNIDR